MCLNFGIWAWFWSDFFFILTLTRATKVVFIISDVKRIVIMLSPNKKRGREKWKTRTFTSEWYRKRWKQSRFIQLCKGLDKASIPMDHLIHPNRLSRNNAHRGFQNTPCKGSFPPVTIRDWNKLPSSLLFTACATRFTFLARSVA